MKTYTAFPKSVTFFLLAGMVTFTCGIAFSETVSEEKKDMIEIKVEGEPREVKPIPRIGDEASRMPEIPKAITREQLGPAEKVQLDELEHKRAKGDITEPEYKLQKDALARASNLKF